MDKSEAIRLLGGTVTDAAKAIGVSTQAISLWPEKLPPRIADRVQAALWRRVASVVSLPASSPSIAGVESSDVMTPACDAVANGGKS